MHEGSTSQIRVTRLTEQIQQLTPRLGESGPEKKVLRARRTRGPKMAKIQKIQKSNRHDQNVGKVKYSGKTRLKIQNHPILVQNHKDSIFLLILDSRGSLYGALFWANRALFTRFGQIGLLIFVPHLD